MLDLLQQLTIAEQVAGLCFALALLFPAMGLSIGAARGVQVDRMSGVMYTYWLMVVVGAVATGFAKAGEASPSVPLMGIAAALVFVPLGTKTIGWISSGGLRRSGGTELKPRAVHDASGCTSQLQNPEDSPVGDRVAGHAGRLGWFFCLSNYYEWELTYSIAADDAGVSATAGATGKSAGFLSPELKVRSAVATVRGTVKCLRKGDECAALSTGDGGKKQDADYRSQVRIRADERAGQATLEVECEAELSGVSGASVSVGSGVSLGMQGPNLAQGAISKARTYHFTCVRVS